MIHKYSNIIRPTNNALRLCYVTHKGNMPIEWLLEVTRRAAIGGVTMVQLREKDSPPFKTSIHIAKQLKRVLDPFKIPLIINDYVEVCEEIGAAGVHLGQEDMHPDLARKILGDSAIIGLSLENMKQAEDANRSDSIDYVAASPVHPSRTKNDFKELPWGLKGLQELVAFSKHPVMGIGGINLENTKTIIEAGAKGVAVISAIQAAHCPEEASAELIKIINEGLNYDTIHYSSFHRRF